MLQRSATESDAMHDQPLSATVLIRKPEVLRRIGNIDNSSLSRWIKARQFPEPVILNPNGQRQVVAWREAEVEAWLASRPRGPAAKPKPEVYARQRQAAARRRADPAAQAQTKPTGRIILRRPT
jgi:predicted DNA-binding transcriptional regulator AlpA